MIHALVMDTSRIYLSVEVCDEVSGTCDASLEAFNSSGEHLWSATTDEANVALAITNDGSLYASGKSVLVDPTTIGRWSSGGELLWARLHGVSAPILASDEHGVWVGGSSFEYNDEHGRGLAAATVFSAAGKSLPELRIDLHGLRQLIRIEGGFAAVNNGNSVARLEEDGSVAWYDKPDSDGAAGYGGGFSDIAVVGDEIVAIGHGSADDGRVSPLEAFRYALEDGTLLERVELAARTGGGYGVFSDAGSVRVQHAVDRVEVFDADGSQALRVSYSDPDRMELAALDTAPDGSFVVGGVIEPRDGEAGRWFLKAFAGM